MTYGTATDSAGVASLERFPPTERADRATNATATAALTEDGFDE